MLLEEWNLDDALAVEREEGKEDGIAIGIEKGMEKGREEGRVEGLEMGLEKGREEVLKLIRQGYTTEQIEAKLAEIAIHR